MKGSTSAISAENRTIRVLLLDMWCFIPYYMAALSSELQKQMIETTVASATYHLDPEYFKKNKVKNDPGIFDIVGKLQIRNSRIRRGMKLLEYCCNI